MTNETYEIDILRAYENLANAIIKKAIRDYQHALIGLHLNPNNEKTASRKREVENFVKSGYYKSLTNVDGPWLLEKAKEQVVARNYKRFDMSED